jgi:uncharacterized membrane protein HdeD (DUF308 family)
MTSLAFTSSPGAAGLFARSWWILLFRGFLAIALGLLVFTRPAITLSAIVLGFSAYCVIEGAASILSAITGRINREHSWFVVLEGIIGIAVGVVTFRTPGITGTVLMFFIAVWALGTGVLRIVEGVQLRKEITGEVWLILGGLASVAFAMLVLMRPFAGAIALVRVLGAYSLVLGLTEVLLAFELRSLRRMARRALPNSGRQRRLDTEVIDPAVHFDKKELHHYHRVAV